jgi:tetratricopeptide (TPR) repeat protein
VIKLSGQLVPIKLDAEKEGQAVAKKYNVSGYPTILFLNSTGEVVYKIGGYMPPADFAGQMENAILVGHLPQIESQVKKNPSDTASLAKLVRVYAGKGDVAKAASNLQRLEAAKPAPTVMAQVYNAMGDMYQTAEKWDPSVDNFKKALAAANVVRDNNAKAYALISIATVLSQSNRMKEAAPYLKELLAMGPEKAPYEETAKAMLSSIGG